MFDVNKMLRREMEFPELFTTKLVTEYGIIFYNPANPLSHDSNHALILDISNPESSIQDIISFYRTRKLVPRLYNAFVDHELDILKPHLESHGFTIESHSDIFLYSPPLAKLAIDPNGDFRKITVISNDVIELFHSDGEGDWADNPIAIRLYKNIGFQEIFVDKPRWSAHQPD